MANYLTKNAGESIDENHCFKNKFGLNFAAAICKN